MSDADVDPETAESLARARLAEALRHPVESTGSDIARLAELADAITTALDRGERPEKRTVEEARFRADRIETRLDEVTALFGWHPWDAGANWGSLPDDRRAEIEARDSGDDTGRGTGNGIRPPDRVENRRKRS